MIIQHNKEIYINNDPIKDHYFKENCIFFDIETTGFSPKTSSLYMIGCSHRIDNTIYIDQFFAENKDEEKDILKAFMDKLDDFDTIITFNGIGFDIPFLQAKCKVHSINEHFNTYNYIDIFKEISPLKKLLNLENYKQKTVENFLGICREDKYSGGDLINVYHDYIANPSQEAKELLLLHNYEDVLGMHELLPILAYKALFNESFQITGTQINEYTDYNGSSKKELFIILSHNFAFPKPLLCKRDDMYIKLDARKSKIRIPVLEDTLYFFYDNYKDYYYLPAEDTAIHKSVASFVDKDHREKCHAYNCYTRKKGEFIIQYTNIMNPEFKTDYKNKAGYFQLTDDFLNSEELLNRYVKSILQHFISR